MKKLVCVNLNGPKGVLLTRVIVNDGNKVIANVKLLVATVRIVRKCGKKCGHMEHHCMCMKRKEKEHQSFIESTL